MERKPADIIASLQPEEFYVIYVPEGTVMNNVIALLRHTLRRRHRMKLAIEKDREKRTLKVWNLGQVY
jgi:hypothetical protein